MNRFLYQYKKKISNTPAVWEPSLVYLPTNVALGMKSKAENKPSLNV